MSTSALLPDARAFAEQLVLRVQAALEPLRHRLVALEQLPTPRDGQDGAPGPAGKDGIDGAPGLDGKDGADGKDGQDGAPGKDGEPGQDGAAGEKGDPGQDGKDGLDGKDGIDGADGLPGEPGLDGRDGRDGLPGVPGPPGEPGKDGRDGIDGQDGRDGFMLEQLDAEAVDGGRVLLLTLTSGALVQRRELRTALMIYRGVFKDSEPYEPGDTVTWGGSLWHCNSATSDRPGDGSKAWTLAVKKGRDGKDGVRGEKGEPGPSGKDGRDLTQLAKDGARY